MESEGNMRAIGTMSGTSMDGVDVALIETDGVAHVDRGTADSLSLPYSPAERKVLFDAVAVALEINSRACLRHPTVLEATRISTQRHAEALVSLVDRLDSSADVIGYHGQTILHRPNPLKPSQAFTLQVGDPQALADATGLPTIYDFRGTDVGAGGQGAPLAPLYHQALLSGRTELPALILNLGGIANITVVRDDDPTHLVAADIGPANVYLDDEMTRRKQRPFDDGGHLAAAGLPDEVVVDTFFDQPFYQSAGTGPASLDRYGLVAPDVAHLTDEDAMATLAELTVRSVGRAVGAFDDQPRSVFVAGGGARNPHLIARLAEILPSPVAPLDVLGASAAMLEAEAFAYLAVRHIKQLPLTYPNTTGAPRPLQGGRLVRPKG